ncbi:helix-turn-helix transcriptional regulator [Neobacillus sp. OS1-2]|uniref:helix-turn-helix domain-containing protein n=1 Tax=Neobacillus sp. OS1-2 TaxID=3070680 RepID=UPI0027E07BF6|nr:helix-turn-helix transcriptional regulator [Neobacillus sp. OS1-2]WML40755.1 helix-turn-helix transcriptional regulator [Neobacillus sp. OS1-2]
MIPENEEIESILRALENNKEPIIDAGSLPINRQIKVKRVHDNFTQTELAEMLGMGVSTLSEIENGHRRIPYKYREKVENYLYREMYYDKEFVGPIEQ